MPRSEDQHSIRHEPHLNPGAARPDASEQKADRPLSREAQRDQSKDHHLVGQSVHDEPNIFPGQKPEVVDRDWTCSNCGYNLRGLTFGTRCPECGAIEIYKPAPLGAGSYVDWLRRKQAGTTLAGSWYWTIMTAVLGGPWAIIAALMGSDPISFLGSTPLLLLVVVFGPTVEEVMKIALTSFWIETRPYVFKSINQLWIATLGSALIFSAIENVFYLHMPWSNPSLLMILWRWTICVAMHVGCTALATRGLIQEWERTVNEGRPATLTKAFPALLSAIVVHGSYNAFAVMIDL
jgi:DNA-directed RNA polymerase subunit RPC12/RpoP